MCVWAGDRQADRQTDRQADRQAGRQAGRETGTETERDRADRQTETRETRETRETSYALFTIISHSPTIREQQLYLFNAEWIIFVIPSICHIARLSECLSYVADYY